MTRNLEIRNSTVWILPNIWRLEKVRVTKFGTNVFHEILPDTAKYQGYSLYRLCVIKGKSTWRGRNYPFPPRLNDKIATLATKPELKAEQDKKKKTSTFWFKLFVIKVNFKMIHFKIIECFSQSWGISKKLLAVNQKDWMMKVLNFLLHLIIVFIQY